MSRNSRPGLEMTATILRQLMVQPMLFSDFSKSNFAQIHFRAAVCAYLLLSSFGGEWSFGSGNSDALDKIRADRVAIERVYYRYRTGPKPPFEEVLPVELADRLVQKDRIAESTLLRVYGRRIDAAEIMEEVQRIDRSSRDPSKLAELKAALDNDSVRFANTVAKPLLVERELRNAF